jgi:GGDEF domain-containing protein
MNRRITTTFAAVCIAAALGAAGSVAYRVLSQDAAGRDASKADFEGLRSVLAYVKASSDLADPGLRARLASRFEASPSLLLVDVYERGAGDRWRMPADSPYLVEESRGGGAPKSSYPPSSTILLSSPLKGDSSGKLAVDALYVSLPQAAVFEAVRDALIALGAFLAAATLVLAITMGRKSGRGKETSFDFSSGEGSGAKAKEAETASAGIAEGSGAAAAGANVESYEEEWSADEKAAAAAQYQFDVLEAESKAGNGELDSSADEEFDIPVMDMGLEPEVLQADAEPETMDSGAFATEEEERQAPSSGEGQAPQKQSPEGLFSPDSGLGWESYMKERLDAEISRSASFEQDLSLLVLCYDGLTSQDGEYREIAKAIKAFFSFRDLAFERGDDGFAIILPNIDSSHALRMAEEFNKKLVFLAEGDFAELELLPIYMGISSRAGRLVDANRLMGEASTALDRARYEKDTRIVAFRPDPDKYRQFLAAKAAG